ncbi:MAG: hypothetical protein K0Q90_4466 [Paenibacillaceae bacterium]|jgi:hypothetical protein|nr:hypothetical protein [Paenibacillaceae bacterium]
MATFIRATDSEAVELEQEWIILHPDQFTVTKINEVGGICWGLLKEPQTVSSMAGHIVERYEIDSREAEADIEAFLLHMQQIGMIRHAG